MGEDRDAEVDDIPEVIDDDGEDEGQRNQAGFPYNVVWTEFPGVDVEPDEPFIQMPPFTNGRHHDSKGHYRREYVNRFLPSTELDFFSLFFTSTF